MNDGLIVWRQRAANARARSASRDRQGRSGWAKWRMPAAALHAPRADGRPARTLPGIAVACPSALACSRFTHSGRRVELMVDRAVEVEPNLRPALAHLDSILIKDETLEAWAAQRRLFALGRRRLLLAATSNRLISLERGLLGGFEYKDLRWQDLKEAHISVGIFGATLRVIAEGAGDLVSSQVPDRVLVYGGLIPEQAQAVYRICQAQDQAWRE